MTRFSVRNTTSNLDIRNVTSADAGLYLCTEDSGLAGKHLIFLSVTDHRNNFTTISSSLTVASIQIYVEGAGFLGRVQRAPSPPASRPGGAL